eukprot:6922985-Lingulodinium_polyedra.AAC.1
MERRVPDIDQLVERRRAASPEPLKDVHNIIVGGGLRNRAERAGHLGLPTRKTDYGKQLLGQPDTALAHAGGLL